MKTYYVYRCPRIGPIGIADRDFVLSQQVYIDFPEPGMMTAIFKSVKDPRFPPIKNRVRATCHIMALVIKPGKDEAGKDVSHLMLVTNIDINGMVPKWIVNIAARSAPS